MLLPDNKSLFLKIEIAEACGIRKIETLKNAIVPLIEAGAIRWDNPGKKKGTKGGKKYLTRFDALRIMKYLEDGELPTVKGSS